MAESVAQSLFSWDDAAGNTHTLDVDVVVSASDMRTAKLTDHVVETGAVITDHVVIQPETLKLELVVSQTPIGGPDVSPAAVTVESSSQRLVAKNYPLKVQPSAFVPGGFLLLSQGLRTAVSAGVGALLGATGVVGAPTMQGSDLERTESSVNVKTLQATTPIDRVGAVHDQLVDILNGALLVTVSFKGRLYPDYLLTQVSLESKSGEFGLGRFSVEARAFRTVTGTTVNLPDPADFRALAKANKGNKPGKAPNPDPSKRAKSWAKRGVNSLNEFFGT